MKNARKAIAAAAMMLCLLLFLQMNTFTLFSYAEEEGYAMPKMDFKKTLKDEKLWKSEDVSLVSIGCGEEIYQNSGGHYVGKDRTRIDLAYPIIVREGKAMRFNEEGAYMISEHFDVLPVYADLILSGGYSFHTNEEKADSERMLLVRMPDELYMNPQKVTIKTYLKSYEFSVNSLLNLQQEYINAYARDGSRLVFTPIRGLQDATITIGQKSMRYTDFLKKLQGSEQSLTDQEAEKKKKEEQIKKIVEQTRQEEAAVRETESEQKKEIDGDTKKTASNKKKTPQKDAQKENSKNETGASPMDPASPSDPETPDDSQSPKPSEKPSKPNDPQDEQGTQKPSPPVDTPPDHENTGDGEEDEEGEGNGDVTDDGEDDVPSDMEYVKPQVRCGDLDAWVYTVHTDLKITDPSKRIIRSIRFNIYKEDGTLLMRKQYREDAYAELSILPPDTLLIVEGVYQYYNEQGAKADATFLEPTAVRTLPIEGNVMAIKAGYEQEGYFYSDHVKFEKLKLETVERSETDKTYKNPLLYVSRGSFIFQDKEGNTQTSDIGADQMKKLLKEEAISVATTRNLNSASAYTWSFTMQDRFGNELATEPKKVTGNAYTSKQIPLVKLKVEENKAGSFKVSLKLEDKDKTIQTSSMRMQILDKEGEPLTLQYEVEDRDKGTDTMISLKEEDEQSIRITNLPFAQQLKVQVLADYDTLDNRGLQKDKTIGSSDFYSASLVSGALNYTTGFTNVLGTSAVIDIELNQKSTTSLVELMTEFSFTLRSAGNEDITYTVTKELFNKADVKKDYDEEKGVLMIQREDKEKQLPEITLEVSQKVFAEEGMTPWQAFVNGGLYGTGNDLGGRMHIRLAENTLIPSTTYTYSMKSTADQGGYRYDLQNVISRSSFTTKKREPQLHYADYFIAQDFMEFYDLNVDDIDKTIIDGDYAIQLVEVNGLQEDIIQSSAMNTGETKDVLRIEGLRKDVEYRLRFVAGQYNDGASIGSMVTNHVFYEYSFKGQSGITANIALYTMDYQYSDQSLNGGNLNLDTAELNKTISTNGQIIEKEGWFITDYIPIDPETDYLLQNFSGGKCVLLYSTSNKTDNGVFTVDGGYHVARATNRNSVYVRVSGDMKYLQTANITDITNKKTMLSHNTLPDTVINSDSGNESYSTSGIATDFIPTEPGTIIRVDKKQKSDNGAYSMTMCYYDRDKKKIGKGLSGLEFTEVVPFRTAYIRVSYTNITENTVEFPIYSIKGTQEADTFKSEISWSLQDGQQFLEEKDTYKITRFISDDIDTIHYRSDKQDTYSLNFQEGELRKEQKSRQDILSAKKQYRYDLSIKYHGRTITLDTIEFNTGSRMHILKNSEDIALISRYPTESFLAVNDISESSNHNFFSTLNFSGTIDFQGHSLYLRGGTEFAGCNFTLANTGIIRNIIIEKDFTNNKKYLILKSSGLIENLIYRPVLEENEILNYAFIENNLNDGILRNFIVELNGEIIIRQAGSTPAATSVMVTNNTGIIENGYVYNKVKNAHVYANSLTEPVINGSTLVMSNSGTGQMKNIFALSDIYTVLKEDGNTIDYTGTIVGNQQSRVSNSFSVGDRYRYTIDSGRALPGELLTAEEPGFGRNSTGVHTDKTVYSDVYQISENAAYKEKFSKRANANVLKDCNWYHKVFSKNSNFLIDDYVKVGYYPRLLLPDSMMSEQPYIKLPQTAPVIKPELINTDIVKQTEDYADVVFRFKNSGNTVIEEVTVEDLDCQLYEQQKKDDFYEVKARVSNPHKFVSSYRITNIKYQSNGMSLQTITDEILKAEFYDLIHSFSDWQRMVTNPSQNYRLKTDLDFSTVSNWNTVFIASLTGKLDGGIYDSEGSLIGMHTLRNIEHAESWNKYGLLIGGITRGEVKNLKIDTIKCSRTAQIPMGVFGSLNYGIVDNVHLRNVDLTGTDVIGGFSPSTSYSTISNSSIKNMKLRIKENNSSGYYFGGFVGRAAKTHFRNNYITGLSIDTSDSQSSVKGFTGAFLGDGASSIDISNAYAEGTIKGQSYIGGLVSSEGTMKIQNCWTKVKIEAKDQNIGGIAAASTTYVKNSLSIGDMLVSKKDSANVHRISGTAMATGYRNYAYENQLINAKKADKDDTDGLLSAEELKRTETYTDKIRMGNAFDYSNIKEGALPLLKSSNGELLPDQEDIYLQSADLKMKIISAKKEGSDYKVDIEVTHPGFQVDSFQMDGMVIRETKEFEKDNNTTSFSLTLGMEKAIDSYIIKAKLSADKQIGRYEEISTLIEFDEPVYWEIHNASQWQDIMRNHGYNGENFKIMGNIDFTGISDPFLGIVANRFVGVDPETSIISNLTFKYEADSRGVIFNTQVLDNIAFKNIDLTMEKALQTYQGIITKISGSGSNLTFSSNTIHLIDFWSNVGTIGQCTGNLENIKISDTKILNNGRKEVSVIGGLAATLTGHLRDVQANNIEIDCPNSDTVGGLVGYHPMNLKIGVSNQNFDVQNIKVKGRSYVGGITANATYKTYYTINAKNIDITGDSYIGGLFGEDAVIDNLRNSSLRIEHVVVKGQTHVGGINGTGGTVYGLNMADITVDASLKYAGGIFGSKGSGASKNNKVDHAYITAKYAAGGVSGLGQAGTAVVLNSEIHAVNYAGGITGSVRLVDDDGAAGANYTDSSISNSGVINSKVYAKDTHAGGLLGNVAFSYTLYGYVIDSDIGSGNGYVGGIVGEVGGSHYASDWRGSYVRNSNIHSGGDYVGGYAGYANFDYPQEGALQTFHTTPFYVNAKIKGSNHVGGLFGSMYKADSIDKSTITSFRGAVVLQSDITASDGQPHIFSENYQEVFDMTKAIGFKVTDQTTLNGRKVADSDIQDNGSRTQEELISEKDLISPELLNYALNNATRPGLNLGSTNYPYTVNSTAMSFYPLIPVVLPKDEPALELYCGQLNGEYKVNITVSGIPQVFDDKVNFENGRAVIDIPTVKGRGLSTYYIKILKDTAILANNAFQMDFSLSYISLKEGSTFYNDENTIPDITLPEGNYVWYRSTVYPRYGAEYDKLQTNSNRITITSRGYYHAKNLDTGAYTPVITVNTVGYMPFIAADNISIFPCQAGFHGDQPSFENAVDISDRLYTGGYKLPHVPYKFSDAAMEESQKISTFAIRKKKAEPLPELDIYASGADSVNVELSQYQENSSLSLIVDQAGRKQSYPITDRAATLGFDYIHDLSFVLTDGVQEKAYTVKAEDVRNSISAYASHYAYTSGNTWYIDTEQQVGNCIHLYQDKALMDNGYVLQNGETIKAASHGKLLQTKSLFESTYEGKQLISYKKFTRINDQTRELRMLVRKDYLYALDPSLKVMKEEVVADSYQDERYLTVLNEEGRLLDLMKPLHLPDKFKNEEIREISGGNDNGSMLVRYENGALEAFNYLNGERLAVNNESTKEPVNFATYLRMSVTRMFSAPIIGYDKVYADADELQKELLELDDEERKLLEEAETVIVKQKERADDIQSPNSTKEIKEGAEGQLSESFIKNEANVKQQAADIKEHAKPASEEADKSREKESIIEKKTENRTKENASGEAEEKQKSNSGTKQSGNKTAMLQKQPYVAVFLPQQESYALYRSEDLLDENRKHTVSENEKLKQLEEQGNALDVKAAAKHSKATRAESKAPILLGFVLILAAIAILLAVLYRKKRNID